MKTATLLFSAGAFICSAVSLVLVGVALKRGKDEADKFRAKTNSTLQKVRDALSDFKV